MDIRGKLITLSAFDPDNPFLDYTFDNTGGDGSAECGRVRYRDGRWLFGDYHCTTATDWLGICMIQF